MKRLFSASPARVRRFLARGLSTDRARWPSIGAVMRASVASAVCSAMLACTPSYDWRTIMDNDYGYEVTLPAKPRVEERKVEIAGRSLTMRMQTAEANDAVFAVGTVVLPSADPALQRATVDFLQQGLARNVNAQAAVRTAPIALATGGKLPGSEIEVQGQGGARRESRTIHARFVAHGTHVYQVAIVSDKAPPAEQADQFFSSFKLF